MTGADWFAKAAAFVKACVVVARRENDSNTTTPSDDPRLELLERGFDLCREYYADLSAQWNSLDSKAQGTTTVAGIFLAGIFSFVRDLPAETTDIERRALSVAILFLGGCVVCALLALRLRSVPEVEARIFVGSVEDFYKAGDIADFSECSADFFRDQISAWQAAIDRTKSELKRKAGHLYRLKYSSFWQSCVQVW